LRPLYGCPFPLSRKIIFLSLKLQKYTVFEDLKSKSALLDFWDISQKTNKEVSDYVSNPQTIYFGSWIFALNGTGSPKSRFIHNPRAGASIYYDLDNTA
jgi:hypothetical protein